MKVKCIIDTSYMTIGKIYDVIYENNGWYCIINNIGIEGQYYKRRFELVSKSEARNDKIDKLLSDEVIE